jgi:hypothetical protein
VDFVIRDLLNSKKEKSVGEFIMVLLLFTDGSVGQIEECEDVVHNGAALVCFDYRGRRVAEFPDREVLGYTLNPEIIRGFEPQALRSDQDHAHRSMFQAAEASDVWNC